MTTPKRITNEITRIDLVAQLLGRRETAAVLHLSKKVAALERRWAKRAHVEIMDACNRALANARETGRLALADVDFVPLLMEQSYNVMREGLASADTGRLPQVRAIHLAAPPKGKVPKSLRALREWWDAYRKRGKVPARQKAEAEKLKAEFLRQIQKAWRENSDEFLSGDTASNTEAEIAIRKRAAVAASRAKMIVETETTYYFTRARREVYDASDDVTHYLFLAVRDHATTKWCKTRHGLVYAKGDPILDKETPPCHWFCRSELVPLTPRNPFHLRLIQDQSKARRHHRPEPLPKGWTGTR